MESKIRIRLGQIEVEYEGSESFLKKELPELIRTVYNLYRTANLNELEKDDAGDGVGAGRKESHLRLSTNSIAAKLRVSSGPDLAVAAAAHITLVKGSELFSRKDLLKEMRNATSYFKESYASNFTKSMDRLLKKKFNQVSNDKYALTAETINELRSKLD